MYARTAAVALSALALLSVWAPTVPAGPSTTASPSATPGKMRAVVRAWSRRLNAGDNKGAARLFSLPAVVIQPPLAYRLESYEQVALWHAGLPCSGEIVSISIRGRYATAVFRLGNRGTSRCDAPEALAAARFGIVRGKIVSWEQVPVPATPDKGGDRPSA
jgi:hypothetical protein